MTLTLGGILKEINKRFSIPYTPMLFMIGILAGIYRSSLGLIGQSVETISSIDPHSILIIFLPVLIFESGFNADWNIFRRQFGQIFILAVPCVMLGSSLLMLCIKIILKYQDEYYTWPSAFMFGSILSCTDTVAVLALLKEIGTPKKFNSLIEGESILNNGTCIVLFKISSMIIKGQIQSFHQITLIFTTLTIGGIIIGIIFGFISSFWIKRIFNDEILVINITLISCYLVFIVAENIDFGIKVSGIIAIISLGLFMAASGKKRIANEIDWALQCFWKYVIFCAETVIFFLSGVIVSIEISKSTNIIQVDDYYKLGGLYLCMVLSRFISISTFIYFLKYWGYGLTWKEVYALTCGGLRGAVGICFALIVYRDESFSVQLRQLVLFDMAGNAVLTLLINGTITVPIVKFLGLCTSSMIRDKLYQNFLENKMKQDLYEQWELLKDCKFLKDADWDQVKKYCGEDQINFQIENLKKKIEKKQLQEKEFKNLNKNKNILKQVLLEDQEKQDELDQIDEDELDQQLIIEVRNVFLRKIKIIKKKASFWNLFEKNQCTGQSLLSLIETVDWDLDNEVSQMHTWDWLKRQIDENYINFIFQLRNWPIIGRFAKKKLYNYIAQIYDMISSYIEAHEIVEESICDIQFDERYVAEILIESQENRKQAESYLYNYLDVSFPEISKSIRTKKAAYTILEFQKDYIQKNADSGQLDEKEHLELKKKVDQNIIRLNNFTPSWVLLLNIIFIIYIFLFIQQIIKYSFLKRQFRFQSKKNKKLNKIKQNKQGERSNNIFIITRGGGTEFSEGESGNLRIKRGVGHILPIQQLATVNNRYLTSFQADCILQTSCISLQSIINLVRKHPDLENFIIKESIPALCKIFFEQFKPLSYFEKSVIEQIVNESTISRYKQDSRINLPNGAILYKGELELLSKDQLDEEQIQDQNSIFQDQSQIQIGERNLANEQDINNLPQKYEYEAFSVVMPNKYQHQFVANKNCLLLEFNQYDQIKEYMLMQKQGDKRKTSIRKMMDIISQTKKNTFKQ
ncbi:sodium hydrogen exchanger family protein, putative [Ichthyophthirius multifiliis]|uniref:Sodium hydrogen exchanger family protein, putative n=1 Tax=Ichthyophthirius multifiliis TaxID=5932 RepID=G0R2A0_ICHMU|nr:sodium hydrogen exchanger family protein, putative [Ichthyophthirius multifiliis]EGR28403.1 sodium hydrogen exchanger family protein, putative [Ichthyophthirius multifiliis]|eukprot:XP_004027986.1 sodium hydrogen exchanger family protein, putative [Ichthyophthirius multifiliis]